MNAKKLLKLSKISYSIGDVKNCRNQALMSIAASLVEITDMMNDDAAYVINLAGKTALEVMESEDE